MDAVDPFKQPFGTFCKSGYDTSGNPCPQTILNVGKWYSSEFCTSRILIKKKKPVDCVWEWSEWSACDKMCGGGAQTRTVKVTTPSAVGGRPCPTETSANQTCNANKVRCRFWVYI